MSPPGPFVLSEALYTSGKRQVTADVRAPGSQSRTLWSTAVDIAVPLSATHVLAGTEEEPDV